MSTREPRHSSDMQQGVGAAPQTLKEPKQARADVGGWLAYMHLCALLNMQGDTSRPAGHTPGSELTEPTPGVGVPSGLQRWSPCWEVTTGAGAACSWARVGKWLTAPDGVMDPRPA